MYEKFYTQKTYIILCEGSSEVAYIQILNRILNDNNINISFAVKEIGTGNFSDVEKAYKKQCKENKKLEKVIWVDKDIYKRNDRNNNTKYAKKKNNIQTFYLLYIILKIFLLCI